MTGVQTCALPIFLNASVKILGITTDALSKLSACDFPGNVRELENEIRRMVALAKDGEFITTRNLSPTILAASNLAKVHEETVMILPTGVTLKEHFEHLERRIVLKTLLTHRWNQSRAAAALGLSRVGLVNKIKRYNLLRSDQGVGNGTNWR